MRSCLTQRLPLGVVLGQSLIRIVISWPNPLHELVIVLGQSFIRVVINRPDPLLEIVIVLGLECVTAQVPCAIAGSALTARSESRVQQAHNHTSERSSVSTQTLSY